MPAVAMVLEYSSPASTNHWSAKVLRSMNWSGSVLALLAALLLRHPLLLQWRPALMLQVFGITPSVLIFLLQRMVRSRSATTPWKEWAQPVLWLTALVVAAGQQGDFSGSGIKFCTPAMRSHGKLVRIW